MTVIERNTEVFSISLPKRTAKKLDKEIKSRGQTRSSFIAYLIDKEAEDGRWQRIYKKGQETARKFKITSEEDIESILNAS